ncbi:diguanylate cyclase [Marinobacter oulmenensis]|uniref:Diguanylate cyclase DosC n=1 Tax=Marinobacter oulmenensis TaxID=643747 RepID=A0A840UFP5_9GAMM|nr:diguanylate cyclase [Marinobacter oulmenensis]MBB5319627.1 diguanylate cyclase [Marinobacter oulmenensis]
MPRFSPEQLSAEWQAVNQRFSNETRQFVLAFVRDNSASLSAHFYREMLADPAASQFLSHEEVHARLGRSMERWLSVLFATATKDDLLSLIAEQRKVGEVHARIDIPVHLVLRGTRCLKDRFHVLLDDHPGLSESQRISAARMVCDTMDLAMEIMSHAYAISHDRNSRAEEAYRLFAITQNIANEKEQQRAALLDWENQFMFNHAVGTDGTRMPRIQASDFGLWFRHKGVHAFEGSPEAEAILDAMEHIDDVLLPLFNTSVQAAPGAGDKVQMLREFRDRVKGIQFHLDHLFEQNNELESGRDVLTRLLNRKFLPVVLGKQISQARNRDNVFALLAIDIDHFKQVNDQYGHQSGDAVLQQLALILVNNTRSGDYLFRLGGEEFMLVIMDTDPTRVRSIAEKLRRSVEQEAFRLPEGETLNVTVSIGVACFDGHPDYQKLMHRADAALYRAKHGGRNRVELAEHLELRE